MRLLLIISTILILSSCSTLSYKHNFKDKFHCSKDCHCILVKGVCGQPIAINKYFEDEHQKAQKKLDTVVLCQGFRKVSWPDDIKVQCTKSKCTIMKKVK